LNARVWCFSAGVVPHGARRHFSQGSTKMKIIQAMKQLKELTVKAEDLREKVGKFCADLTIETPTYPDQRATVMGWIQAHGDIVKRISELKLAIQRTNLATNVTIELDGKQVTKPIAAWIHRRRDLATLEHAMWSKLSDRNLKEQNLQTAPGGAVTEVRIRRYFDPAERDSRRELYRSEPSTIDATLEVVNATTDLLEAA
jgi:hypothetical protein